MTRRGRRRLFPTRRRAGASQLVAARLWRTLRASALEPRLPPRTLRLLAGLGGLAVVLSSLGIVAFRTEILRARYELGDLVAEEARLREERAALRVAVRRLRDPERLERLARDRGFGPPERVLDLSTGEPR